MFIINIIEIRIDIRIKIEKKRNILKKNLDLDLNPQNRDLGLFNKIQEKKIIEKIVNKIDHLLRHQHNVVTNKYKKDNLPLSLEKNHKKNQIDHIQKITIFSKNNNSQKIKNFMKVNNKKNNNNRWSVMSVDQYHKIAKIIIIMMMKMTIIIKKIIKIKKVKKF